MSNVIAYLADIGCAVTFKRTAKGALNLRVQRTADDVVLLDISCEVDEAGDSPDALVLDKLLPYVQAAQKIVKDAPPADVAE